jgi:hypothetical protein
MRVSGRLTRPMDMYNIYETVRELTSTWTGLSMSASGLTTNKMEKEKKFGLTELDTKVNTIKERSTEGDNFFGLMDQFTKENSS